MENEKIGQATGQKPGSGEGHGEIGELGMLCCYYPVGKTDGL